MKYRFPQRGASAVEFALVLPLLIVLTFGIIEFGLLMYNYQVITNAAREGARYGIVMTDPLNAADDRTVPLVQGVVSTYASTHLITLGTGVSLTSIVTPPSGHPFCDIGSSGLPLTVTANYGYGFLTIQNFIPGLGNIKTLSSTAVMNCE